LRVLKHNKAVMIGGFVLILFFGAAIFADQLAPYDPLKTSSETFESPSRKFLFGTDDLGRDIFSGVIHGAQTSILVGVSVALLSGLIGVFVGAIAGYAGGAWDDFLMRLTELFLIPPQFFLALVIVGAAIFADQLAPYDPLKTSSETFESPSRKFLFGTDDLGRDIFSGVIHGAQTSILVGVSVALLSGLIGVFVGAIAGYAGGAWDDFLMRLTELFLIPPQFFLALVIAALFGSSLFNIILILTITGWTTMARLVRAEVLSLKERSFVEASKAMGASPARILFHDILPNASPLIITKMILMVGGVILLEAGLEFVGLGDANHISWGYMLHNGQHFIRDGWWIIAFPSLALAALVLALNVVGDALNSALNPKARGTS
jgi:peptide/nickel transport system permease protein